MTDAPKPHVLAVAQGAVPCGEIARLRKGIQDYLDGNYANPRDGRKKNPRQKCPHGMFYWDACENCIDEHFAKLLAASPAPEWQPDEDHPDCNTRREAELYFALMLLSSAVMSRRREWDNWEQGGNKVAPIVRKALRLSGPLTSTNRHPDCPCEDGKCIHPRCTCALTATARDGAAK